MTTAQTRAAHTQILVCDPQDPDPAANMYMTLGEYDRRGGDLTGLRHDAQNGQDHDLIVLLDAYEGVDHWWDCWCQRVTVHLRVSPLAGPTPNVACGAAVDIQYDTSWMDAYDDYGIVDDPAMIGADPGERITEHTHDLYSARRIDPTYLPSYADWCVDCDDATVDAGAVDAGAVDAGAVDAGAVAVHRTIAGSGKTPTVVCGADVDVQYDASWLDAYDPDGRIRDASAHGADPDERITDITDDLYSTRRIDPSQMPAWAAHCPDCWLDAV